MAPGPAHRKETAWITSKTTGAKSASRTGVHSRLGLRGRAQTPRQDKAPHHSVHPETSREAKGAAPLTHARMAKDPPEGPTPRALPEGPMARDLLVDPRARMDKGPHAGPATGAHAARPQGPQAPLPRIVPRRTATFGLALPTPTPQAANRVCPSRPCKLASAWVASLCLAS